MADQYDRFSRVLTGNAVERCAHSQHKLCPALSSWGKRAKGVLLVIDLLIFLTKFLYWESIGLTGAHLLYIVIWQRYKIKCGCNNLRGLKSAGEGAGNQDIRLDLPSGGQAVTQALGLQSSQWREPIIPHEVFDWFHFSMAYQV